MTKLSPSLNPSRSRSLKKLPSSSSLNYTHQQSPACRTLP
ncbi:hypothetical protein GQ600_23100 [Phytophthora cactorum]|nr:hypothetical protein GQ600_23100 [Phytophthora cactorum]